MKAPRGRQYFLILFTLFGIRDFNLRKENESGVRRNLLGAHARLRSRLSVYQRRIQNFDLICRHDVDLGFAFAKFDCAGDADDFPLDRGKSPIGRYWGASSNEPGERLIGVFSSEIDKCCPQRGWLLQTQPGCVPPPVCRQFKTWFSPRSTRAGNHGRNRVEQQLGIDWFGRYAVAPLSMARSRASGVCNPVIITTGTWAPICAN